ncbi:MAG: hydrogenase formation protein HypD [Oscillospiraceae bacterium]|nr:hydrogenase formation protein HypD [Oscillospiraceae bacterium]
MPSAERCRSLLRAIEALPLAETQIMEVCGTHTMAIAKAGIRSLLPPQVRLLSGPGCPVCVTPQEDIDAILELAMERDVILSSYGDMLRVPGSRRGDSLLRRRALGADVRIVYSPMDALEIAAQEPGKQVVFLGIGFETTAPGTAAAILAARERGLRNFSVLSLLKSVEPALRTLMAGEGFAVDGFLCPGHVATIIGEKGFRFLPEEYHIPGVIGGFEPEEILTAIWLLLKQIAEKDPKLRNAYPRAVRPEGNPIALRVMEQCLEPAPARWRGLGMIPASGFRLREALSGWDAEKRFAFRTGGAREAGKKDGCGSCRGETAAGGAVLSACRCGDVITGRLRPTGCPLFGKVCTPEDPVGPCMVSGEGACAAEYKYRDVL